MSEPLILKLPAGMRAWALEALAGRKSIGFVPTMGNLHEGHRSLMERARAENDRLAVSIFVNPTQFGPGEDFANYPRTFEEDRRLCAQAGADAIFAPEVTEMYAPGARTWVEVGGLTEGLCGLSRPGHFRGVATVVAKLFHLVLPTRAYFGKKDFQQLRVIQSMVRDLDFGCEVIACDTVREESGLALSSRNRYLTPGQRKQALVLHEALEYARKRIHEGERDALKLCGEMAELVEENPDAEIDYISIADADSLEDLQKVSGHVLIALAVRIGKARLIDNIDLKTPA